MRIKGKPYPYVDVPNGRAFCCANTGKIQASLKYIHQQIQATVYPDTSYTPNADLTSWSNQGVLLLNSAFTVPIGKPGHHQILWRPFMAFLLDILSWHKPGMIYVFMGKIAAQWADSIPDNTHKIFVTHPASAAYNNMLTWDSQGCFVRVNELLEKAGKSKIVW